MAIQVNRADYLAWDPVAGADSYEAILVDFTNGTALVSVPGFTLPEVAVFDLGAGQPAATYYVKVRAKAGPDTGPWSGQVAVEITAPEAPINIIKKP